MKRLSVLLAIVLLIGCAGKKPRQTVFEADGGNNNRPGNTAYQGYQEPVPTRTAAQGMAWVAISIDPSLKIYQVVTDVGWKTYQPSSDGKVWLEVPVLGYYQVNVYLDNGLPSVARQGDQLNKYFNVYASGVALEQVVVGRRQGTNERGESVWLDDAVNYRFQVRYDGSIDPRPPVAPNYQGR